MVLIISTSLKRTISHRGSRPLPLSHVIVSSKQVQKRLMMFILLIVTCSFQIASSFTIPRSISTSPSSPSQPQGGNNVDRCSSNLSEYNFVGRSLFLNLHATPNNNVDSPTATATATATISTPVLLETDQSNNGKHSNKHGGGMKNPFIELTHKETNTTIVLIGCLHGSSSSSNDVKNILNEQPTDVVILELCPTRYKDLIKYTLAQKKKKEEKERREFNSTVGVGNEYLAMVFKTIQTRGISTGLAAGVLGGASSISNSLSGFETGLEFITAIDFVKNQSSSSSSSSNNGGSNHHQNRCDIILGDRFVDETLKSVGSLPKLSLNMWNDFMKSNWDWEKTYGIDANVISNAISGDEKLKQEGYQIDMAKVLTRNEDVKNDIIRLLLPTFIFVQLGVLLFNLPFLSSVLHILLESTSADSSSLSAQGLYSMLWDIPFLTTDTDWKNLFVGFIVEIITSGLLLLVGYIMVALPAVRVILTERDEQLYEAIEAACKVAAQKSKYHYNGSNDDNDADDNEMMRRKRVVAVLGLLHVNGIAKKLIET